MSTRTEHIARLTEMSVRAQAIADELAQNAEHGTEYAKQQYGDQLAAPSAHVERLLTDIRSLVQRAESAERDRDMYRDHSDGWHGDANRYAGEVAAKDAEIERLTRHLKRFHEYLAGVATALGDPGGSAYADLPRLVRELRDERDRASQGWCQALESNKHLLDRIRELEDAAEPNERVNFAAVAEELQKWNNPADPKFVLHHCDYGDIVRTVLASALINECDTVDHYTDDPCTAIYERSDDEVDDYYCCLRHGHDGDHVNEDGRSWPDTADRAGADAGQAFHDGDRVAWHHGKGVENGTVDIACHAGKTLLRLDNGKRVWVHPEAVTPIGEREGDR